MTSDPESSFEAMLREAAELRTPSQDGCVPAPGDLLQGKYRIEERLGAGGMGVVLRATNMENGKQVAIKWPLRRTAVATARFSREARAAALVDHPNVVNVFDIGVHDGRSFLVMELLRGTTLRKRLAAGRMTPRELMGLMLPVLRGVRAAHAAGVIHRDLKPDNVFLCVASDGTEGEPKVLDFGISKLRGSSAQNDRITADGALVGTLPYMSPEQLMDGPDCDERSDIYAAGVMMYEALAGRLPFQAASHNALILALTTQQPTPIAAQVANVDHELARIVMRAIAKDVRDRQATVQVLLDEMTSWQARAAEVPSRAAAGRSAGRRVRTWSSAALVAALAALSAWLFTRPPSTTRDAVRVSLPATVVAQRPRRQASVVAPSPGPPSPAKAVPVLTPAVVSAPVTRHIPRARIDQGEPVESPSGPLKESELW